MKKNLFHLSEYYGIKFLSPFTPLIFQQYLNIVLNDIRDINNALNKFLITQSAAACSRIESETFCNYRETRNVIIISLPVY